MTENEIIYFISQSTTTHIVSYPSDYSNPVMMSFEILVSSFKGIEKDFKIALGHC
jgi:hypothetical protein